MIKQNLQSSADPEVVTHYTCLDAKTKYMRVLVKI